MTFDPRRYDRDVIGPLRGVHGHLPPGDLWIRYAMEPDLSGAALVEHLERVRDHWRRLARRFAPDASGRIAKLLLAADQELAASAGDAMLDINWWRAQSPHQAGAAPTTSRESEPATAPFAERTWREEARDFIVSQVWPRPVDAEARVFTTAEPVRRDAQPLMVDRLELSISLRQVLGSTCHVVMSWPTPAEGAVCISRFEHVPPRLGPELVVGGVPVDLSDQTHHEGRSSAIAEVPLTYHVYVPMLVVNGETTIGRFTGYGIGEPARNLRSDWRGDHVLLTWTWPLGGLRAQLEWSEGNATRKEWVSYASYRRDNGYRFVPPRTEQDVTIRMVSVIDGHEVVSAPRAITIGTKVAVRYSFVRARWISSNSIVIMLLSDQDCPAFELRLVVSTGAVLPLQSGQHQVIQIFTELVLRANRELRLPVKLPPDLRKPYWLRCFTTNEGPAELIDPSVSILRVS